MIAKLAARRELEVTPAGDDYATACVATLTGDLLADGVRECLLFTDVKNPTSNAIYARIGDVPRLDFEELRFAQAGDATPNA